MSEEKVELEKNPIGKAIDAVLDKVPTKKRRVRGTVKVSVR